MSYSLHFRSYEQGEEQFISTKSIIDCFKSHIVDEEGLGFKVEYGKADTSFVHIDISNLYCSCFTVSKPCGDDRFYHSLLRVTKLGNYICILPDGLFIVFDEKTLEHLPIDLTEDVKQGRLEIKALDNIESFIETIQS